MNCRTLQLHHKKRKWTLQGNFIKIQDLRLKLVELVEVSFVIMIPTSCYVRYY